MGIPKKALKKSQLEFLTAGPIVSAGSHQISRVNFIEHGVKKLGFYKAIEPTYHYPELLALISVATSGIKRSFQGAHSAEERLVFDDDGRLVGTLSIAVDGFKSLNIKGDEEPIDPIAKELVVPSTKTLIEKNMIEVLFGRYFLDDDDSHPQNIGFAGDHAADIDYDMFWYWFTIWMKEPRPIIGVPKKHVSLTVDDWEAFPRTKDAKHYHWPTYERPGEKTLLTSVPESVQATVVAPVLTRTLPKPYPEPTAFQMLANSKESQEQKLASALRILLTYQPEVLRARLVDLFDDLPLNYTSLGAALSAKYEVEFPKLCNAETNIKPFVDFMMSLYQTHYDSLYRVVVFYMGNANNGFGVPLPATYQALYETPSFYAKTKDWIAAQNTTLYSKDSAAVKFNGDELKKRYHQIWRDAFAPRLKTLLHQSSSLTNEVIAWLKTAQLDKSFIDLGGGTELSSSQRGVDESFTRASELFGKLLEQLPKDKIMREIDVDPSSGLAACLHNLIDFTNELTTCTKTYYDKSCSSLTDDDNAIFVKTIQDLCSKHSRSIRIALANTSSYCSTFVQIARDLDAFAKQADFEVHLTTTDEQMKAVSVDAPSRELPLIHPDTLQQFNEALFLWAKSIDPAELSRLINEIIDTYYTPTLPLLSYRGRTDAVKTYLTASIGQSGNNRLAYILSSGSIDAGALNQLLIEHLTPQILKSNDLPTIKKAVKSGAFAADIQAVTVVSVRYAKTDSSFTHLCHEQGIKLFYETLFAWVDACDKRVLTDLISTSLATYEGGLAVNRIGFGFSFGLFSTGRRSEVINYFKKEGQGKALALTFLNEGKDSTLNQTLFKNIVAAIQEQVKRDRSKLADPGYKLLALYVEERHLALYLAQMSLLSGEASHKYSVKTSAAPATAI